MSASSAGSNASDPGIGQAHLFEPPQAEHLTLADRFLVPPFSVFEARAGYWQERKRDWLNLGIVGELGAEAREVAALATEDFLGGTGRAATPKSTPAAHGKGSMGTKLLDSGKGRGDRLLSQATPREGFGGDYDLSKGENAWGGSGTSIFDPVLCEIAYRWFTGEGMLVYDPFAGGSVRGVVAACLGRRYIGIDLRPEQCQANEAQADQIEPVRQWAHRPRWVCGDSRDTPEHLAGQQVDFVFSCPPYFDLEQYSSDPRDLSNAGSYSKFLEAYEDIIAHSVAALKPNRFACFVVGEVRAKDGGYVGLVPSTIQAFQEAGATFYNEAILVTSVGSLPIRTSRTFGPARKLGKSHQNVLVFVKGDGKAAAAACGTVPEVALEYGGAVWRTDATLAAPSGETIDLSEEDDRL